MKGRPKRSFVADDPPDAAQRFEGAMKHLLSVSKEELARREAAYQRAQRAKAVRPGRRKRTA